MFFKKYYTYYLLYNFEGGYGSMELTRDTPIITMQDINSINSYIQETQKYKSVMLTNWIKIKTRKDAKTFLAENGV